MPLPNKRVVTTLALPGGLWYVRVRGDVMGRLSGTVTLLPAPSAASTAAAGGTGAVGAGMRVVASPAVAVPVATQPQWSTCSVRKDMEREITAEHTRHSIGQGNCSSESTSMNLSHRRHTHEELQ